MAAEIDPKLKNFCDVLYGRLFLYIINQFVCVFSFSKEYGFLSQSFPTVVLFGYKVIQLAYSKKFLKSVRGNKTASVLLSEADEKRIIGGKRIGKRKIK